MIPRIVISPPFGNYLNLCNTVSVCGSYTVEKRPGLVENVIKSLRPVEGGWVNKIGLRNPGIRNVPFLPGKIYSLAPLTVDDYDVFYDVVPADAMVEINLSCPNTDDNPALSTNHLGRFVEKYPLVICKVSPRFEGITQVGLAYREGVRYFHMCNTLPSERGGISGYQLQEYSLRLIRWTRKNMPSNIQIIGGGGIYHPWHVDQYHHAGANYFSLSTVFFTPWKVPAIIRRINSL